VWPKCRRGNFFVHESEGRRRDIAVVKIGKKRFNRNSLERF
jgi:hypothetical protein